MIKSEIFASVLRDVCEVTGISERDIMSKSKSEEIVDTRHLLVMTLRRSGYYPGMIAERMHISGRAVRYLRKVYGRHAVFLRPINRAYRDATKNFKIILALVVLRSGKFHDSRRKFFFFHNFLRFNTLPK